MTRRPSWRTATSSTLAGALIPLPLMKVPLVEPRSITYQPPTRQYTEACRRLTASSRTARPRPRAPGPGLRGCRRARCRGWDLAAGDDRSAGGHGGRPAFCHPQDGQPPAPPTRQGHQSGGDRRDPADHGAGPGDGPAAHRRGPVAGNRCRAGQPAGAGQRPGDPGDDQAGWQAASAKSPQKATGRNVRHGRRCRMRHLRRRPNRPSCRRRIWPRCRRSRLSCQASALPLLSVGGQRHPTRCRSLGQGGLSPGGSPKNQSAEGRFSAAQSIVRHDQERPGAVIREMVGARHLQ
jgi:hypothetical protein